MNLTKGDTIRFTEPIYTGAYPSGRFAGNRTTEARIYKESYGEKRGQHSFMLEVLSSEGYRPLKEGSKIRRLGRKLYKACIVIQEANDKEAKIKDKQARARISKDAKYWKWIEESANSFCKHKLAKIPSTWIKENREEIYNRFLLRL